MRNILIMLVILLIILTGISILYISENNLTGNFIWAFEKPDNFYSYTKAICNQNNYCRDYEIFCNNNKIVKINPTGNAVQFPSSWKDPRSIESRKRLC